MLCSKERILVFDAEANGLLHNVTKMYCIVAEDYETGERFLFHDYPEFNGVSGVDESGNSFTLPMRDGTLKAGVQFIHHAKQLICHNVAGYDLHLLKKFYPKFRIRYGYPEIRDTLLESQLSWYDRPMVKGYKGIHGLAVWGARIGIPKPEIEDWSFMDAAKLHRCLEDVSINTEVARRLDKEFEQHKKKRGADLTEAMRWEQEYRYFSTIQELNGALVDASHMERCVVELDVLIEELRVEIEPKLPPTLKIKAAKEEAHFVAKLVGAKTPPDRAPYTKIVKGELVAAFKKTMHKPTMKFQNVKKQKIYAVTLDGEQLIGHTFFKLKEAREWAKENHPDVKKGFKYPSKETETKVIDAHTKAHFAEEIESGTEILGPFTKVVFSPSKMSQHEKVKLLLVSLGWQTDEWTFKKDSNDQFVRADMGGETRWPSKPIKGFQLKEKYKKGDRVPVTPKITEDSFQWLPEGFEGLGKKIKEYNTYVHRRGFIQNPKDDEKGLLNNIREDGRVSCGIMTFGTTAGRAAQYGWVNAPGVKALYGENIRKIIVAPKGSKLMGIDMPSAHPRLLADFTNNQLFIDSVDGKEEEEDGTYVGEDFHTVNSVLFELNTQEDVQKAVRTQDKQLIKLLSKGRGKGKGGSYCTLYGGSDKKLALTIGIELSKGARLKEQFLSGLGLDVLLREITKTWGSMKHGRGSYIAVLGGYIVWCSSKHKIINYKALGSEAVLQKVAVVLLCRKISELCLKTKLILNVHDEVLLEVPDEEVETMRKLGSQMYVEAAKVLGLRLDWTSVAKVGINYAVCH
jgi:hypothetical protein